MLKYYSAMSTVTVAPGQRILLVDDDQGVREALKLLLAIDRHMVTEAASGQEAIQHLNSSTYDLVITDYLMPEMLGDELARRIKKRTPTQPILMVTAYLEKLAGIRQPVDAVLGKPVSLEDLRCAMASQLHLGPACSPQKPPFNFAGLTNRASATTSVLDEILRRKRPARALRDWYNNH
jgi:CheY-like chemotaxis protein